SPSQRSPFASSYLRSRLPPARAHKQGPPGSAQRCANRDQLRVAQRRERLWRPDSPRELRVDGHGYRTMAVARRGGELGVARDVAGVPEDRPAGGSVPEDREPGGVSTWAGRVRGPLDDAKLPARQPAAGERAADVGADEAVEVTRARHDPACRPHGRHPEDVAHVLRSRLGDVIAVDVGMWKLRPDGERRLA